MDLSVSQMGHVRNLYAAGVAGEEKAPAAASIAAE
jgi:hypothetical protein